MKWTPFTHAEELRAIYTRGEKTCITLLFKQIYESAEQGGVGGLPPTEDSVVIAEGDARDEEAPSVHIASC